MRRGGGLEETRSPNLDRIRYGAESEGQPLVWSRRRIRLSKSQTRLREGYKYLGYVRYVKEGGILTGHLPQTSETAVTGTALTTAIYHPGPG